MKKRDVLKEGLFDGGEAGCGGHLAALRATEGRAHTVGARRMRMERWPLGSLSALAPHPTPRHLWVPTRWEKLLLEGPRVCRWAARGESSRPQRGQARRLRPGLFAPAPLTGNRHFTFFPFPPCRPPAPIWKTGQIYLNAELPAASQSGVNPRRLLTHFQSVQRGHLGSAGFLPPVVENVQSLLNPHESSLLDPTGGA